MPTITAQQIIDTAELVLQDSGNVRWTALDLLGYLNDGQRAIAAVRPDVSNTTASMALVAGTRQSLPAAASLLVKATRNMGAGGSTPGAPVRQTSTDLLDAVRPTWHSETGDPVVRNYTYDPTTPRAFHVWPPSTGTTQLEIVYQTIPAAVAAIGNAISIPDTFAGALTEYVLYMAFSMDVEEAGSAARAAAYHALFERSLGLAAQADAMATKRAARE